MDIGNILFIAIFLVIGFVLVRYVLPKMGIHT